MSNKAVENKDPGLSNILGERLFSNIHDDPRWLPFLERIGYSPEQLVAIEFKVTLPKIGRRAGRQNNPHERPLLAEAV